MPVPISTKSRADLKVYFRTGSRPTAAQFGELIDSMVNAKDDSLAKSNATPLRLQAEQSGQANSIQKVVEFYNNFADANPTADLSLKSTNNPAGPLGLSINVGGTSRMTFDANTLNIGIGTTTTPLGRLEIIHDSALNNTQLNLVESAGNDLARLSFQNNNDRTKAWHIAGWASNPDNNPMFNFWHSDHGDVLSMQGKPKTIYVNQTWQMWFGNQTRQMINLWGSEYGVGVQGATLYFRSFDHFAWHKRGVHSDAQLDAGAGGTRLMYLNTAGELAVSGAIHAQNSDMYFTKTDHNHTGTGNTIGFAAIENSANYGALMILGRNVGPGINRVVKVWDLLEVNGSLNVTGRLRPSAGAGENGIVFPENPGVGGGDRATIQYFVRGGTTESTTLAITNMNDGDDHIELSAGGQVIIHNGALVPSDKRLKENIQPLAYGLAQIKKLLPVSYDWKNRVNHKKTIGLLAQDVEPIINEAIYENKKDENESQFCLSYNSLIPVLINAIKELDQKLETAQLKIAQLEIN